MLCLHEEADAGSIYFVICQRFHLSQAYMNVIKFLKADRCFSVKQEGRGLKSQLGQELSVWSLYVLPVLVWVSPTNKNM